MAALENAEALENTEAQQQLPTMEESQPADDVTVSAVVSAVVSGVGLEDDAGLTEDHLDDHGSIFDVDVE